MGIPRHDIQFTTAADGVGIAYWEIGSGSVQIRVGMAAGESIHEDGDLHGAVVSQASRVTDLGSAGEVIVADSVGLFALGKGYTFERVGEVSLKGFSQPTTVWKVTD